MNDWTTRYNAAFRTFRKTHTHFVQEAMRGNGTPSAMTSEAYINADDALRQIVKERA